MKYETVKLATNIPIQMILAGCYYNHSEDAKAKGWAAQLALTGTQNGKDIKVYVPLPCGKDLTKLGYLKKGSDWTAEAPTYAVVGHPAIQILRTEEGKKKLTTITSIGEHGAPPSAPQDTAKAPAVAPAARNGVGWQMMGDRYLASLKQAQRAFQEAGIVTGPGDLHAAAATIMIAADRMGVTT